MIGKSDAKRPQCNLFGLFATILLLMVNLLFPATPPAFAYPVEQEVEFMEDMGSNLLPGDIYIIAVVCPYDRLVPGQTGVPLRIDLVNRSDVNINILGIMPLFTAVSLNDRSVDYIVYGDITPNVIMPPGYVSSFYFTIDVSPTALTDEKISVDAFVGGQRMDNLEFVSDTTSAATVRDEFTAISYGGNDGSEDWSGDWQELGEMDGPSFGDVMVRSNLIPTMGNSLHIGGMGYHGDRGASREADLSGANSAVLTFEWQRDTTFVDSESDIYIQISNDGGSGWTTLQTITKGQDLFPTTSTHDISSYITPNTQVRFITSADGHGYVYFDNVQISYDDYSRTHHWVVLSEAINAIVALFDTRLTQDRSDDSLICLNHGEYIPLNEIYYLNEGKPLAEIPLEDNAFYRLVVQLNPSFEWEYEPKDTEDGYFAFTDPLCGFGRLLSPRPGLREFLLTEFFVLDEESDPADFVVGTTRSSDPAVPWDMLSDPWIDPIVDTGKTGEFGSIVSGLGGSRWIIDCNDDGKDWEVTGKCETDRYYFYETWFQPGSEWAHGDIADIYLHIYGKPEPKDIEEFHFAFGMVDDDTAGPVFSEFSPSVIPEGEYFTITCRISDPSGVYDDDTGSGGQGVYILVDDDGSLEDGALEVQMDHVGSGYYRTVSSLLSGSGAGGEVIYKVFACDDDADWGDPSDRSCAVSPVQSIPIIGSVRIVDEPGSLHPQYIFPGQEGVTLYIELGNPMPYPIFIYAYSTISFSSGTDTVTADLGNWTYLFNGAANYPVAFEAVDIPAGFSAPDTLDIVLEFWGEDYYGYPFYQKWTAASSNRLVVLEPTVTFKAHAVPSGTVHPAETLVELLSLEVGNFSLGDVFLDSLVVTNVTIGSGGVPQNDANIAALYLYRQGSGAASVKIEKDDNGLLGGDDGKGLSSEKDSPREKAGSPPGRPFSPGDSLVAVADLDNGTAIFSLTSGSLVPAWQGLFYYVAADVDSFRACDGDSLDIEITSPGSIFMTGNATVSFAETPLNSPGKSVVDGFPGFQLFIDETLRDTLYMGDSNQPVLALDIPANGYSPDVLTALSIRNYGDAAVDDLVENLRLWIDDGDSVFSATDDILLGDLYDTGDRFEISGISRPVAGRTRIFVTADFNQGSNRELEVLFGIPTDGISYISGNDGPTDGDVVPATSQLLIRREIVSLEGLPIPSGTVYPGDTAIQLLAFSIYNNTLGSVTFDSLRAGGDSAMFACEPAKTVELYRDDGDNLFGPDIDTLIASSPWKSGSVLFADLDLELDPGEEAVFFSAADLDSFLSVDGETLMVGLESAEDIYLSLGAAIKHEFYELDADFPLFSEGGSVTDGMLSHQVELFYLGDSTIIDQSKNNLILDIRIPGNGCLDDTLKGLTVLNSGTAGKEHVARVSLWEDDGDGLFDPLLDDSLAGLTVDQFEVMMYTFGGLTVFLPGSIGQRLYVTVDLQENIETVANIRAGIPKMGIEVGSGNDGPLDDDIVSESILTIPVPDRVTLYTSILSNKRVQPGESHVLNMVVGAYNSYSESKILQSLLLFNTGTAYPSELTGVAAFADSDGDGFFDPLNDDMLEMADFTDEYIFPGYIFDDLGVSILPYKSSLLFIAYTTVLHGIRDSVSVNFEVMNGSFVGFLDETITEGHFPLDSSGEDHTDGMVTAQIDIPLVRSVRVSPGDRDVLCISFRLPCNGTLEDEFNDLILENLGTGAPVVDIEGLRLWRESMEGSYGFDPGEDEFISLLSWDTSHWRTMAALSYSIACEGLTLYVTADISSNAVDSRTIQLSLPVDGVRVSSGNDGPIDGSIDSPAVIEITTDPLLASLEVPRSVTREQEFEVRMLASNGADTSLTDVMPDSFSYNGGGSLILVSGPEPPVIGTLPGGGEGSFVWRCRAQDTGEIVFRGRAVEGGGSEVSLFVLSDTLQIEEIPDNFSVVLDDLSPVSLNKGREDAPVIEMEMSYQPPSGQGAGIEFAGLEILFADDSGAPIPVKDVASRVFLEDESMVLCSVSPPETTDSIAVLVPAEPVLFLPGYSKTFRISIDVSTSATAENFKLYISATDNIVIEDRNNGNPIDFQGTAFPWSTNTVSVKDPASALMVRLDGLLPGYVNRGQEGVEAFMLSLSNKGDLSSADISVSEIVFKTKNEAGDTIEAGQILKSISVTDGASITYYYTETFAGSASIRCRFQPALNVSPQIPVSLYAVVDCLNEPAPGGFSVTLEDTLDVVARDVNSGQPVAIEADPAGPGDFPMSSGVAVFLDPLSSFSVSGEGLIPGKVTAGQKGIDALRVVLRHTGDPGQSRASCTGVELRFLDETGQGLEPYEMFDAVFVRSGVDTLAEEYFSEVHSSDVPLAFSNPILTAPGETCELDILVDFDDFSQSGYFQIHINAQGFDVTDATDGRTITDLDGEFPLTSGIGNVIIPAEQVVFGALGRLPENIAAGEGTEVFSIHFEREEDSSDSDVLIEHITLDFLDENNRIVDPELIIESINFADDFGDISTSYAVHDNRLHIDFMETIAIGEGESMDAVMGFSILDQVNVEMFSVMINSPSDISCSDETSGEPVAIHPVDGSSFPYSSGMAALIGGGVEEAFLNYPNPFVSSMERTRVTFQLPADGSVTLKVYTIMGRLVKILMENEYRSEGLHQDVYWDGRNGRGEAVLNGIYYLVLETRIGSREQVYKRKVSVIR